MSVSDNQPSCSSYHAVGDFDPLFRDLNEKKQSFCRNVLSLAIELKEARSRLASQEKSYAQNYITRQKAEAKAKNMEVELERLHKRLEDRGEQLQTSSSIADKYLNELEDLRSLLAATQETADARAASAKSAHSQCHELLKELDEKNKLLKMLEDHVIRLEKQLENLQKDQRMRESSQKQLRNQVLRIEPGIMQASSENEVRKVWEKEKIDKLLLIKDEEIAKLKDEIKILSAHWKHKTKELESQLEKQGRADQELKKKVLKLEFCLQETRSQTRKLQRLGERQDKAMKELEDQLAEKQRWEVYDNEKQNFWESSGFKVVVSVSMLVLVIVSKRVKSVASNKK